MFNFKNSFFLCKNKTTKQITPIESGDVDRGIPNKLTISEFLSDRNKICSGSSKKYVLFQLPQTDKKIGISMIRNGAITSIYQVINCKFHILINQIIPNEKILLFPEESFKSDDSNIKQSKCSSIIDVTGCKTVCIIVPKSFTELYLIVDNIQYFVVRFYGVRSMKDIINTNFMISGRGNNIQMLSVLPVNPMIPCMNIVNHQQLFAENLLKNMKMSEDYINSIENTKEDSKTSCERELYMNFYATKININRIVN
jgi:hypothetical protein